MREFVALAIVESVSRMNRKNSAMAKALDGEFRLLLMIQTHNMKAHQVMRPTLMNRRAKVLRAYGRRVMRYAAKAGRDDIAVEVSKAMDQIAIITDRTGRIV